MKISTNLIKGRENVLGGREVGGGGKGEGSWGKGDRRGGKGEESGCKGEESGGWVPAVHLVSEALLMSTYNLCFCGYIRKKNTV